jgi:hypothetical protein
MLYEVVDYSNDPHKPKFIADCGCNDDSEAHAQCIVADHKVAPTAPHECSDPQCPGDVNRRKLAAFDGLLSATQKTAAWLLDCAALNDEEAQAAKVSYFPKLAEAYKTDAECYRAVAVELNAAIANATKQTAPAEGAMNARAKRAIERKR